MRKFYLLLATCLLLSIANAHVDDPVTAVQGLVRRVLGDNYLPVFRFEVIPADSKTGHDVFELDSEGKAIVIRGNNGVSLSAGLGWYLK